jgi:hypothetical protein
MAAEPVPAPEPEPEPEPMYGDCGMDVVPQEWQHGHMGALPLRVPDIEPGTGGPGGPGELCER